MPSAASGPPELVPVPDVGRRFSTTRRVRWGDTDRHGRVRLDALARYLQDLANDDTRDAGQDPMAPWIVRRTAVVVRVPLGLGEVLTMTTFNGGLGSRWAERRTSVTGDRGGSVEAASTWIFVDPLSGRPARLTESFLATYASAALGRKVDARLRLRPPPDGVATRPWLVRSTDFDRLGHVNNAATWEPVEDELDRLGVVPAEAEIEYGEAIAPGDEVALASQVDGDGTASLWLLVDGVVRAAARARPRPTEAPAR